MLLWNKWWSKKMDLGITVSSVELFYKCILTLVPFPNSARGGQGGWDVGGQRQGGWDVGGQRQGRWDVGGQGGKGGWDVGWVSCSHELLEARREGGGGGMGGWPPLIHTCCHGPMCV